MKNIEQPAIPEWLAHELFLPAVIEVDMHAPFLQDRVSLRRPTHPRLPVTAGWPAEYASDIVKARTPARIELLLSSVPPQHRLIDSRCRLLAVGVRVIPDLVPSQRRNHVRTLA